MFYNNLYTCLVTNLLLGWHSESQGGVLQFLNTKPGYPKSMKTSASAPSVHVRVLHVGPWRDFTCPGHLGYGQYWVQ